MSEQVKPYPLRLGPYLRAWLEQQAAINQRSLNGQIIFLLEQAKKTAEETQ